MKKNLMKRVVIFLMVMYTMFTLSCTTISDIEDYSAPKLGITNNVNIATKDFVTVGIIFVNSVEEIDDRGSHTGSKITHEMFMREAVKMNADDVINIKIDVNIKKEQKPDMFDLINNTIYSYTGTGLAIKYTGAVVNNNNNVVTELTENPNSDSIDTRRSIFR